MLMISGIGEMFVYYETIPEYLDHDQEYSE
jgi:hypothetical protein